MKKNVIMMSAAMALCAAMALSGCSKDTTASDKVENTENTDNTDNTEDNGDMSQSEAEYQAYLDNLATQGTEITQLDMPEKGEEIAVIHTNMGDIKVKFFEKEAPKAVENFKTHAKDGYYDGIIFHRVINNFMIQGGDPTGTGSGHVGSRRNRCGNEPRIFYGREL